MHAHARQNFCNCSVPLWVRTDDQASLATPSAATLTPDQATRAAVICRKMVRLPPSMMSGSMNVSISAAGHKLPTLMDLAMFGSRSLLSG